MDRTGHPSQAWMLEHAGDDFYRIKAASRDNPGCFDLDARLDRIEVRTCTESPAQLWRIGRVFNGARLFNKSTGPELCVDVHPTSYTLMLRRCLALTTQAWQIDPVAPLQVANTLPAAAGGSPAAAIPAPTSPSGATSPTPPPQAAIQSLSPAPAVPQPATGRPPATAAPSPPSPTSASPAPQAVVGAAPASSPAQASASQQQNSGAVAFATPRSFEPGPAFRLSTAFKAPDMVADWIEAGDYAYRPRLTEKTERPSQAWTFDPAGSDFYRIRSRSPGKAGCLGLDQRLVAVEVQSCTDHPSQVWRVGQIGSRSRIFNKVTGSELCIDVAGSNLLLVLRPCANFTGQYWQIQAVN